MSEQKTHYRKAFNSPYLSSADITEPVTLTVLRAALEPDKSKKSKDLFNTVYFVEKEIRKGEQLKPMILNATNSKMMKEIANSYFLEDWNNLRISVYVQQGIKFGRDTVDGLRISPAPVRLTLKQGTPQWDNAKAAFKRDGNLDKVLARVDITPDDQALIKLECKQ